MKLLQRIRCSDWLLTVLLLLLYGLLHGVSSGPPKDPQEIVRRVTNALLPSSHMAIIY